MTSSGDISVQPDMDISPIVVDVETAGLSNAADYLEPIEAARNLRDPEKIKADIEQRTADRNGKLALDYNVGRIVAIAWWTEAGGTQVYLGKDEHSEATALMLFWREAKQRTIVGFNIKDFDLKFMIQRSRYLGVAYPDLDLGKYCKRGIEDLFSMLTFLDGIYDQGAMRRTLKQFCRRFGIPVTDTIDGKDIPALVAAGDWDAIANHCTADVELEVALARRLGVIAQPKPAAVAVGV